MRKRWATQYGSSKSSAASGHEEDPAAVETFNFEELMEDVDLLGSDAGEPEASAANSVTVNEGDVEHVDLDAQIVPFIVPDAEDSKRPKYTIVDKTTAGLGGSDAIADVRFAVPDVVEKEALRLTDKSQFKYPWEKGRLAKFFGKGNPALNLTPKLQPSANNFVKLSMNVDAEASLSASLDVQHTALPDTLYVKAVKAFHGGSYIQERSEKRDLAIKSWWELISIDLAASDPGRTALAEAGQANVHSYGLDILDACVALRSPNTLLKRLYSLKSFAEWTVSEGLGPWLPLSERVVWKYAQFLRQSGAAATKATSLLEAIRFGHFLLRLDGADLVLQSLRVRGLAAQLYTTKRPWRPSDPFTVKQVLKLHQLLENANANLTDRIFAGHILHLVYGRCRWSDLLAVGFVHLDEQETYLEAEAWVHKTAKTADAKTKLLPIVTPARGITGTCWAKTYLELRETAGLCLPQETPGPMLVAPSKYGEDRWTDRYLTSQEGSAFLKLFFHDDLVQQRGSRLTSHSCKATGISWCAKYGTSEEDRAVLGRHSTVLKGSTALYSRDLVSAALRSFQMVINQIYEATFNPDAGRSGMITPKPLAADAAPQTPQLHASMDAGKPQDVPLGVAQNETEEVQQQGASPAASAGSWGVIKEEGSSAWKSAAEVCSSEGVIDLESEPDLGPPDLLDCQHDLSDADSDCDSSSSSSDESEENEVPIREPPSQRVGLTQASIPHYFINTSSLVLHAPRNGELFRCGRKISKSYVAVGELNGLRCGICFAK